MILLRMQESLMGERAGVVCKNRRGFLFVELVWALFLLFLLSAMVIELCRRSQYEVLMHRLVFSSVRLRALGASHAQATQVARKIAKQALNEREARKIVRPRHLWVHLRSDRRLESKLYFRYPGFLSLVGKHHFEITKKCQFSF